jgi:phenylacetate-CoA ligase
MLNVKGINVFPSGIGMVINEFVPDVTGEFQVVLSAPGPQNTLEINIEYSVEVEEAHLEGLSAKIEARLREKLTFSCHSHMVPAGSISRSEMGKVERVVKNF